MEDRTRGDDAMGIVANVASARGGSDHQRTNAGTNVIRKVMVEQTDILNVGGVEMVRRSRSRMV